jgi:hypothetical protein
MRGSRLAGCIAIAAAALAVAPAAADAMIQLDRGIAGVRIGNTRAAVKAALGTPVKQRAGSNDFGRYVQYLYGGGITVTFQGEDRVSSVLTIGLGDRTSSGIGVGSPEADVRRRIPGVKCETIGTLRSCHTGRLVAGRKVTDFRISNGKVTGVFVGQVLD